MTKPQRATIILRTLKQLYPTITPALQFQNNLQLLVAVMLSAQTTDKQVNKVTPTLFKKYRTARAYAAAGPQEFEKDIASIGLYKGKAKNIRAMASILEKNYGGHIPKTIEELVALPGVGRKTANVVLGHAHGVAQGIAVDTHVRRLAQKHGLTSSADPKKIEQDLMQLFPRKEWIDLTNRFIQYGRDYCPARNHNHEACPLVIALRSTR